MPASASRAPHTPAPVNIVVGDEELLVERAVGDLVTAARAAAGSADEHDLLAASLTPGQLAVLVSPSLFGGGCVVVIRAVQDASKDVAAELVGYAAAPAADAVLVLTHAGGAKGKALLDTLTHGGSNVVRCPKITRFAERLDFVRQEFRRAGRSASQSGVRALVDAVGQDLRDLAAACSQLAGDTTGKVDETMVATYYRGRAEATGFSVADQAVEGRLGAALEQLRWALAVGVSPVLITSALAQGVRSLAKVGSAPRGRSGAALATELGMPSWKVDRVRQQLRGWTPTGVASALRAVADADAEVKGGGTNSAYALERAITSIVTARSAS
ncbi:MAG TPA: DNA polymerase III subunit delta [Streptosporangiaceae bacterium]|nr:DNA polymerase III subunit delta [Streptosporangiaceae bacterium]